MTLAVALPQLTEEDPEVAGEGSIDPLGLAPLSELLGELLLPGITNRMRRPRLLTAMAVGAVATDGLEESIEPADGRSTPSVCFEWLVLEALVDRQQHLPPDAMRQVPGSAKVRAAAERREPLSSGNYLKTPNVFGFTGVLLPWARSCGVLDRQRRPAERAPALIEVWEAECGNTGYLSGARSTPGGELRSDIRGAVEQALRNGRSSAGRSLRTRIAAALRPDGAGPDEKRWLRRALTPDGSTAAEIADLGRRNLPRSQDPTALDDRELLTAIRPGSSRDLRARVDAIVRYEAVATRLETVLSEWQWRSTLNGLTPTTAGQVGRSDPVVAAAAGLHDAISAAREALDQLDPDMLAVFDALVAELDGVHSPVELAERVMAHHEVIQSKKPPHGKRPWFEPAGAGSSDGLVVRSNYRLDGPPLSTFDHFGRPYRVAAFMSMLRELR